ncbi:mechanosensitive ion channel domain-containing protein [Leifsonia sp. NPDC080035]|uniref:Mechanosensitive ion channel domain-containing protein n=1 Tax=Leifsonia sp. NPDC080035 TaxID=3143936 RepID=A0AAU7GIR3_9MICO
MVDAASPSDAVGFFAGLDPWDVGFALASVVAGVLLGIAAYRGVQKLLGRIGGLSPDLIRRVARISRLVVILLGVGIAIAFLGAPIQPVLAIAVIVAVVAVLALRGISENFAAGVVLQTRRPFHVGDVVEISGFTGIVRELNSRTVVLRTMDGRVAHIPNADVIGQPFVNESELGGRRAEVQVRVAAPPAEVEAFRGRIADACASVDGVHKREPVRVLTTATEPGRLTFTARFWHQAGHGPEVVAAVVDAITAGLAGTPATVTSAHPEPPLTPPGTV